MTNRVRTSPTRLITLRDLTGSVTIVDAFGISAVAPLVSVVKNTKMVDYDGRQFRSVENSTGGDVGAATTFHYRQVGDVVWATYSGGAVRFGTLLAKVDAAGHLEMRYQHVSADGEFKTGQCQSRPELLSDGRLRLHEQWRWTGGAQGEGVSIVEETPF